MTSAPSPARVTRWKPWAHALAAFVLGASLVAPIQFVVVATLFSPPVGLAYGLVALAGSAAVFGALGWGFTHRRSGWLLALTSVPYLPAAAASTFVFSTSTGFSPGDVRALLLGGGVAAVSALLAHPGVPRILGAAGAIVAVGWAAVAGQNQLAADDLEAGHARFGSSIRPDVTEIDGYRQVFEPRAMNEDVVVATYRLVADGQGAGEPQPEDIALVTERGSDPCASPVVYAPAQGGFADRVSCERAGEEWLRTSESGHELTVLNGDGLLRAGAAVDVPVERLRAALEASRPMDDRYYRHLLFGEDGEYIEELDGLR